MKKNWWSKAKWILLICAYILVIVGIAGLINFLMSPSFPSISSINAPTWLTFWGSYLGGAIGCLPAIAALQHSRQEARRQHEKEQNDARCAVMPVFDCRIRDVSRELFLKQYDKALAIDLLGNMHEQDFDEFSDNSLDPNCNYIDLCNCGLGPALQVKIFYGDSFADLFHLKNGFTSHYILDISVQYFRSLTNHEITFHIDYMDIYANHYSQAITFEYQFCTDQYGFDYISFRTMTVNPPILLTQ